VSTTAIPFNRPAALGRARDYVEQVLASGHWSGDGPFTRQCHALLEQLTGCPRVLLTTSCTHALEMAALLLDLAPGDEVIVPSFTFVSTANAFALRGARIVFADVRPDTFNLDERLLPGLLTPRTRAVVPVHYAGVGCELDAIGEVCARAGVPVVEDNAQGLLGTYRGRPLGRAGCLSATSFHETKNFACGEGGALFVNDAALVERAEIFREKGTDRSRFFRGQVDKYTWVDLGSSYLPGELLAAVLLAQLEERAHIAATRERIWQRYRDGLAEWAARAGARLPVVPEHCGQTHHMFYVVMPSLESRQRLIAHLKAQGILAVFHYQALHLSPMGRRMGGQPGHCPVTEHAADHLLRLPLYNTLSDDEQGRVIEAVRQFA
jgi:dTDP-4-amino-4,6-dideoxygalactose transaminase